VDFGRGAEGPGTNPKSLIVLRTSESGSFVFKVPEKSNLSSQIAAFTNIWSIQCPISQYQWHALIFGIILPYGSVFPVD